MKRNFVTLILFLILLTVDSSFSQVVKDSSAQPVCLRRTEVHKLIAKSNNVLYPIYVSLPGDYNFTQKSYPVVFMLDAYSSFGIMTQMVRLLTYNKDLPELIIVGISSEGGSKEFNINRARDYTPTISKNEKEKNIFPISGGADKYLEFIKDELIPFVQSKYRIDETDKTLVGHSLGGLFCFYTLFNYPELFQKYVIISPALFWDNEFILQLEKSYFEKHRKLNAIVYTAVGSLEESIFINAWQRLVDNIKLHSYSDLQLEAKISENETHYTIIPYISTHGLISVFKRKLKNE